MKNKRLHLFKIYNVVTAFACISTLYMNQISVDLQSATNAKSSIGGNSFEYATENKLFSISKNGDFLGSIPTDRNIRFQNVNLLPSLKCNAIGVGVAALAGAATAGAGATIGGAAVTGAATMVEIPGSAAVSATLGGAGVAAADAAVTAGSMSVGATIAAAAAPVIAGAVIVAGIA